MDRRYQVFVSSTVSAGSGHGHNAGSGRSEYVGGGGYGKIFHRSVVVLPGSSILASSQERVYTKSLSFDPVNGPFEEEWMAAYNHERFGHEAASPRP